MGDFEVGNGYGCLLIWISFAQDFHLGNVERSEASIEMEIKCLSASGLTVPKTHMLFRVTEEKFNLEACGVVFEDLLRIKLSIGRKKQDILLGLGI